MDFLYVEWNNKAVGFVGYGTVGGARAIEHLRCAAGELQMANVRAQVGVLLATDFRDYREFAPAAYHLTALDSILDQVIAWTNAFADCRRPG